jgi:hypothetical protein
MALLQRTFLEEAGLGSSAPAAARRVPDWGAAIFSPLALCIRPQDPEQVGVHSICAHRQDAALVSSVCV